jgi:tetratricopeptide (TPR) repeat protein
MLKPSHPAGAAAALAAQLFFCACFCACAAAPVRVPALKPAEINMAGYQSVGIGSMTGNGNAAIADGLEEALVNSQRFQVVDRQHMSQLLKELQLTSADLRDPATAQKLGKVMTAGAIILGEASDQFRETPSSNQFKDSAKASHAVHSVKGEVYVRVTFRVVDVASGQLIVAKTYEERRDDVNSAVDKRPETVDRRVLERAARQAVIARFMKAIVPHTEYMEAKFEKDSDMPQLEAGIAHAQRGEWKEAQEQFNAAVNDAENVRKLKAGKVATCYWDLGLSYEYAGDYAKADETIGKAYKLSNDPQMVGELDAVRRLSSDSKRQAGQPGEGPAGTK